MRADLYLANITRWKEKENSPSFYNRPPGAVSSHVHAAALPAASPAAVKHKPNRFILATHPHKRCWRTHWWILSSQQYHRSSLEAPDSIIFSPSHYRVPNQHPLTGKRPCSLGLTVAKQKQNKTGSYCKHVNHGEYEGFFPFEKKENTPPNSSLACCLARFQSGQEK